MPRRRRSRQVDLDPGTSRTVEGPFRDNDGEDVNVTAAARRCDETGIGPVIVTKATGRWHVELPPDAKHDLEGLVGEDGVAVRLTIVSGPCPESGQERPGQPVSEPPEPLQVPLGVDAEAAVRADDAFDEAADLAAGVDDETELDGIERLRIDDIDIAAIEAPDDRDL